MNIVSTLDNGKGEVAPFEANGGDFEEEESKDADNNGDTIGELLKDTMYVGEEIFKGKEEDVTAEVGGEGEVVEDKLSEIEGARYVEDVTCVEDGGMEKEALWKEEEVELNDAWTEEL